LIDNVAFKAGPMDQWIKSEDKNELDSYLRTKISYL
jgi:hypothetical protein